MPPIEFTDRLIDSRGSPVIHVTADKKTVRIYRAAHLDADIARRRDEVQLDRTQAEWLRDALTRLLEGEGVE